MRLPNTEPGAHTRTHTHTFSSCRDRRKKKFTLITSNKSLETVRDNSADWHPGTSSDTLRIFLGGCHSRIFCGRSMLTSWDASRVTLWYVSKRKASGRGFCLNTPKLKKGPKFPCGRGSHEHSRRKIG